MKKPLSALKGIGPKTEKKLNRLDLHCVEDLLENYPRTYVNKGNIIRIGDIKDGDFATIKGRIAGVQTHMTKFKKSMLKLKITDGFGYLQLIFFNAPYLQKKFQVGDSYYFFGQVKKDGLLPVLFQPEFFPVGDDESIPNYLGISPIYPLTDGLTQNEMTGFQKQALTILKDEINETFPKWLLNSYRLCERQSAVEQIHFPSDKQSYKIAKYRLVFEELFELQAGLFALKRDIGVQKGYAHETLGVLEGLLEQIPFDLTQSQSQVVSELFEDMKGPRAMNRLIQGDVGSGKTIVAFMAMVLAYKNGHQSVLMVPTEILAEQHFRSFQAIFGEGEPIALLTGSTKKKDLLKKRIESGEIKFLIATHAVLEDDLIFDSLSLVITDEQHRFGVGQRLNLLTKGMNPHVLVMSATPIPRTLSLILYGDVDISVIKQLPSGRKPILTEYVPAKQFEKIHTVIQEAVERCEQVFLVCPLVVESETLELNSAEKMWESLSVLYPHLSIGLVHGKLKSKEKDQMMRDFEAHKIDVLVATTVIEVGINVPRATVMVIMDADRFGLSQLHQLRGRVGRGGNQSYCYLISNQPGKIAKERISTMVASTDGFYIADQDLALRGPGEFFGTRQHGLPQLKLADLSKHLEILATAQEAVRELFNRIEREEEDMAYLQRLKQSIVEKFAL